MYIKKFRIIDERRPSKIMFLWLWKPDMDTASIFHENHIVEITNVVPSKLKDVIETTKMSNYKFRGVSNKTEYNRVISSLTTVISVNFTPYFNEFDTIGIVIHIGTHFVHKNIECVYIADTNENILAIKFWKPVKEFCDYEILQLKNIVFVKNLQLLNDKLVHGIFAEAYSNERTSFEIDVCGFGDVDIDSITKKCLEKIEMLSIDII